MYTILIEWIRIEQCTRIQSFRHYLSLYCDCEFRYKICWSFLIHNSLCRFLMILHAWKHFQKYNSLPKSETLIKFPDKFEMYSSIDFWTCTFYNQQCNSIEENMDSTRRGPKRDRFPFQNPLRLPTPSEVVFLDSDHGKFYDHALLQRTRFDCLPTLNRYQ